MGKIYARNIKKLIDLKYSNWINNNTTNCYAFALGLDIPEKEICYLAYNGGIIYKNFTKHPIDISKLTHKDLIELDFQTIRLYFEQIELKDRIYSPDEWKIAFFNSEIDDDCFQDFHFFREVENGIWYHKLGDKNHPICYDDRGILITNPIQAYIEDNVYEYQCCYRLSKKKLK